MRYVLFMSIITFILSASEFRLKKGDFLFQDLNCGDVCKAIDTVTHGYRNTEVSHVAMVISVGKDAKVIEAIGKTVHLTSLKKFLTKVTDRDGNPMVYVGRVKPKYRHLIDVAVKTSLKWKGLPYNFSYYPNNNSSFYCTQLIHSAFKISNNNKDLFKTHGMNFKKDGKYLDEWVTYFKKLKVKIPQGKKGSNPGMFSRSDKIDIIHYYSKHLRENK